MISGLRHNTSIVAFSLLAMMLAVLIPKDLYHLHQHSDVVHTAHTASLSEMTEDCAICDFQLLPFTFSFDLISECKGFKNLASPAFIQPFLPQDLTLSFSGRAPPPC